LSKEQNLISHRAERPLAVIVAAQLQEVSDQEHEANVNELTRLVETLGYTVVASVSQKRESVGVQAVLGEGKLKELAAITGGRGSIGNAKGEDDSEDDDEDPVEAKVALVAVNHEITPSQARNLERASGVPVLDRTGVIVEIFHRNAKTRQAKLQVEIARLRYETPRVRESSFGKERQQGRGAGEAALELDKRKVRDRIKELEEELAKVAKEQDTRREARREARRVSLVGYTNAGKSSLMRALTGSQVLVEDKLFATLDTTVRALTPETKPRILVSDTVGFIKDLPHDLVASFKSTLDEAREASLLLHVVDASDPGFASQMDVTTAVLDELGTRDVETKLVLNKADRLNSESLARIQRSHPDAWTVSAHQEESVAALRAQILAFFESRYVEALLRLPFSQQSLVSKLHEEARVEAEDYDESGCTMRIRTDAATLAKYRAWVVPA
jgi:GTPase